MCIVATRQQKMHTRLRLLRRCDDSLARQPHTHLLAAVHIPECRNQLGEGFATKRQLLEMRVSSRFLSGRRRQRGRGEEALRFATPKKAAAAQP